MFKKAGRAFVAFALATPFFVSAATCPTLTLGSTGARVTTVQTILQSAYTNFPTPTGYFGPLTQAALKQWQEEHGIESVGAVGPKTAAAMKLLCTTATTTAAPTAIAPSAPAAAPPASPGQVRTLVRGISGADVLTLQQFLISQKLLPADSATGFFGALTEAAVRIFQVQNKIVSSGTPASTGHGAVGPRTRAAIATYETSNTFTAILPSSGVGQTNPVPGSSGGFSTPSSGGGSGSGGGGGGGTTNPVPNPNSTPLVSYGKECSDNSSCQSGYCYPGPEGTAKYCIAKEKNCAKPGTDGVMYGESYTSGADTYQCIAGQGLVKSQPPVPPSSVACKDLFANTFVMGGYSGGTGSGNVITPAMMKRDGWNLDGPHNSIKTYYGPDYLAAVKAERLCTVYTVEVLSSNSSLYAQVAGQPGSNIDGTSDAALRAQYVEAIKAQVRAAVADPALNELIAGWYFFPEEVRANLPNDIALLRDQYYAIKELDPYRRPVFSYQAGDATVSGLGAAAGYSDVTLIGEYLGYDWNRSQILFGAENARAISSAASTRPMLALQMFQSYDSAGIWLDPGMSEFPYANAFYMPRFVRHDVYASIAQGMRGFIVFSFADRVGFRNYSDYYNAYASVVKQIRDNGLDAVFAKGIVGDAVTTITTGSPTVTFGAWGTGTYTYRSVSVREWLYSGKTYVLLVNTSSDPLTVQIDYVPSGGYTDLFGSGSISAVSGRFSTSMPELGVKLFVSN